MSAVPRVLVTDVEERSAVAACRGLASAGYRVTTAARSRLAPGHWSRVPRLRLLLPDPREDPVGYVGRLAELLARHPHDVVLPGSEASLLALSEHRAALGPGVAHGFPAHGALLRALDKLLLLREAAAVGLDAPESTICSTADEARDAARRLGMPVVLKPARSFTVNAGGLVKNTVLIVHHEAALPKAVEEVGTPLAVQVHVPEAVIVSCAGVWTEHGVLGPTCVRYQRTWPPAAGSASAAQTEPFPADLLDRLDRLLARIGWVGIFEVELLALPDGKLMTIDLNPRIFGWLALAVGAGANLPALWCDTLLGRPVGDAEGARPGVVYRWEDGEFRHLLLAIGRGRVREAARLARPRGAVHPYFELRDPGPLFARILSGLLPDWSTGRSRKWVTPPTADSRNGRSPRIDRSPAPQLQSGEEDESRDYPGAEGRVRDRARDRCLSAPVPREPPQPPP